MNLSDQVRAKAEALALSMEAQAKTLQDADLRARALKGGLDRTQSGLGAKVAQQTVLLQRQGVAPISVALHRSLVNVLDGYIWSKLEGADALSGCCGGMGSKGGGASAASVIEAIALGLEATMGAATSINSIVQNNRDAAAARRAAQSESDAYIQQQQQPSASAPPSERYYGPAPAAPGLSPTVIGLGVLAVGGVITAVVLASRKG